jgi:ethanolamine ammonia-lyase small subunit
MGVYVTYRPRLGRTDAERYCLSNIRDAGTLPEAAAEQLRELISRSLAAKKTGV